MDKENKFDATAKPADSGASSLSSSGSEAIGERLHTRASSEAESFASLPDATVPLTTSAPRVFVSYRVRPDEGIARALKQLLETALVPSPQVFVSGAGGIRASNVGARQQIKRAAMSASSFISIITKASKDREWIFFEAGAAFGRDVMYAPLLIDLDFSDLPNTINDYQAFLARDKSGFAQLIQDVAASLQAEVQPRFGQRYAKFLRHVEGYCATGGIDPVEDNETQVAGAADEDPVLQAFNLQESGDRVSAAARFEELLESPSTTDDDRCRIMIARQLGQPESVNWEKFLDEFPEALKSTPRWQYWRACYTSGRLQRRDLYESFLSVNTSGEMALDAMLSLAEMHAEAGHIVRANELLRRYLCAPDVTWRAAASGAIRAGSDPYDRLIALLPGAVKCDRNTIGAIADLCVDNEWQAFFVYVGWQSVRMLESDRAWNHYGIALNGAGWTSLAFRAYRKAAELGTSVALANMAALLGAGAVPEAGLEIFRDQRDFDAKHPDVPYEARARLERIVARESADELATRERGRAAFVALTEFVEASLRSEPARNTSVSYDLFAEDGSPAYTLAPSEDGAMALRSLGDSEPSTSSMTITRSHVFPQINSCVGENEDRFFVLVSKSEALALRIDGGLSACSAVEWFASGNSLETSRDESAVRQPTGSEADPQQQQPDPG